MSCTTTVRALFLTRTLTSTAVPYTPVAHMVLFLTHQPRSAAVRDTHLFSTLAISINYHMVYPSHTKRALKPFGTLTFSGTYSIHSPSHALFLTCRIECKLQPSIARISSLYSASSPKNCTVLFINLRSAFLALTFGVARSARSAFAVRCGSWEKKSLGS